MLAWRRSSLSLTVAALIIGRLALEDSADVIAVASAGTAVVSLWALLASFRGGRWSAVSGSEPEFDYLLRDGVLPAAIATVAGSLCLIELALSVGRMQP